MVEVGRGARVLSCTTTVCKGERSHNGPLFSKFNVLNVHDTFKLNLGIFMYKHHSNQLPTIFSTYFTKHVQTFTQQEMPKTTVLIKQRKCFLIVQLEIVHLLFGILWTKL